MYTNLKNKTSQTSVKYEINLDGNVQIFDLQGLNWPLPRLITYCSLEVYIDISFVHSKFVSVKCK